MLSSRSKAAASRAAVTDKLEAALDYQFREPQLLLQALTHRSAPEAAGGDNERLEFLGDAVLELRVSERILAAFPDADEGELTRLRGWMVSARNLATTAEQLDLGAWLRLSRSEDAVGGRHKLRLLANAMEAVLAAVYQDGGYDAAAAVIDTVIVDPSLARHHAGELHEFAYKSALQERAHAAGLPLPVYRLLEAAGPDHAKCFSVEVTLADGTTGRGSGTSKKEAEQRAAAAALASRVTAR